MAKRKKYKRTNTDLQNIHIQLKIEEHEPHWKPGMNSGATPLVAPVELI